MSRRVGLGLVALALCACNQPLGVAPAQLSTPHQLALVPEDGGFGLLFMAATAGNELRVFNAGLGLPGYAPSRDFVRAPNPLEPLSVPVVDQPLQMAQDLSYDASGNPLYGPYLYVAGAGTQEVSVVSSDLFSGLIEVERLVTPGVVTAMAARAPDATSPMSRLYVATQDGVAARLYEVDLPPPQALTGLPPALVPIGPADPGQTIQALLPLPSSLKAPLNRQIAVSMRSTGGGGQTVAVTPADPSAGIAFSSRPLDFPEPVTRMMTNPTVPGLPAGSRIYGLLDESACGGQGGCRGILAVDSSSGTISLDGTGNPMLPIDPGGGPIQSFTLTYSAVLPADQPVYLPGYACQAPLTAPSCLYTLLGAGTTAGSVGVAGQPGLSGGTIFFFDGQSLQLIAGLSLADGGFGAAVDGTGLYGSDGLTPLDSGTPGDGLLPSSVTVGAGAARTEAINLIYGGAIPGLIGVSRVGSDGGFFPASAVVAYVNALTSPLVTVQSGDLFFAQGLDGGTDCATTLRVGSVSTPPATPGLSLDPTTPVPPGCASFSRFTVRAAMDRAQPYVVEGTVSGFLGRVGPNEVFDGGSYYFHPPGYAPSQPGLTFAMGPQDPTLITDERYIIFTTSTLRSYSFWPDPSLFNQLGGLPAGGLVPDDLVFWALGDTTNVGSGIERLYVSYPSNNSLLELDPRFTFPTVVNSTNFYVFGH